MVIKYCLILQNMCVEEQTAEKLDDDVVNTDVLMGGGVNPMWGSLVRLTGKSVLPAGAGSIAAVCKTARFTKKEAEYKLMRHLLVRHVWDSPEEDAM